MVPLPGVSAPRAVSVVVALAITACAPPVERFIDLAPVAVSSVPLTRSSEVSLADEETVCVVDSYDQRVTCVDRAGSVVGDFGGEGEGPGEFVSATLLARGPGGTVGVFDWGQDRMTVFMPDGTLVSETKTPLLFSPARSFLSTVSGYSVGMSPAPGQEPNDLAHKAFTLFEIDANTGEVLWARDDFEYLDEDGCYPRPGALSSDGRWVFKGCRGDLYFLNHRDASPGQLVESPTYVPEFPNDRDVAAYLAGMRGFSGALPGAMLRSYEEEYRARPKRAFLGSRTLAFDGQDRLWYATTRNRDTFSYLDVWVGTEYAGTLRIRDRLMGYDVLGSTLVAFVERKPDRDGIAFREIDWYDIGDVEFGDPGDDPTQ